MVNQQYMRRMARSRGQMLSYAKQNLDAETAERIFKGHKSSMRGITIYTFFLLALLFVPMFLFFDNIVSSNFFMVCFCVAIISIFVYIPLSNKTFGKDWNEYVKWYTKSGRKEHFKFK